MRLLSYPHHQHKVILTKLRRKKRSYEGENTFARNDFWRKLHLKNMEPGQIYHVFNHATGWENLFQEPKNYHFFMEKMDRFLSPTIDIFAHCLMPNHFHLAVGIPEMKELILRNKDFNGLSEEDARARISSQMPIAEKAAAADFVRRLKNDEIETMFE